MNALRLWCQNVVKILTITPTTPKYFETPILPFSSLELLLLTLKNPIIAFVLSFLELNTYIDEIPETIHD